jgi:molybdopterin-containing oxidoreductase family iron-sulfur binding subunit
MNNDTQNNLEPLDLNTVRDRLSAGDGPEYWRSLDEAGGTPAFQEALHNEFSPDVSVWGEGPSRRSFLKLAGASMALAGAAGCARQPQEHIVPYVKQPEELVPGQALHYATAMTLGGYATGLLVESHTGRPTKIEGNPNHPASLGATDAITQASVLTLYDPDRAQGIRQLGAIKPWEDFSAAMAKLVLDQGAKGGAGLRILTQTVTSPTLKDQLKALDFSLPEAQWHHFEPVSQDNARAGLELALGRAGEARYHLDKANVILSLDADFLYSGPGSVRYARDFSSKRTVGLGDPHGEVSMNRLYVAESTITTTGAMADHRLSLRPSQVEAFVVLLASHLGIQVPSGDVAAAFNGPESAAVQKWIAALADDFAANRGAVAVIAGAEQSPLVHALAHAINDNTGSVDATVSYTAAIAASPRVGGEAQSQSASLAALVAEMDAGEVDALVILGGNPVYDAPGNLKFAEALAKVPLRIYHGLFNNETADQCHWMIPATHELEGWSDARAYDGTASIIQPLVEPLYDGKTVHEVMAALLGTPEKKSYDLVRAYWQGLFSSNNIVAFDAFWRESLASGVMASDRPDLAMTAPSLDVKPTSQLGGGTLQEATASGALEVAFRADPSIYDGRFANNGWLQEMAKPLTKITWENAVLVAPKTATERNLHGDSVVRLTVNGVETEAVAWVQPGHPQNTLTVFLGHGRTRAGRIGNGVGFDAYALRHSDNPWATADVRIEPVGIFRQIARTEEHHAIDYQEAGVKDMMETAKRRHLIRTTDAHDYAERPHFAQEALHEPGPKDTMYPSPEWDGHKWGMTIDLNTCTGCNACLMACQSENNIPVVGKDQVIAGREMAWIRVDRYYGGTDLDNPEIYHQPLPCMQCENAPCEAVCPAAATVHSAEGLNEMVYNRCVGTRYCSNNCPYKVRRFNFLHFSKLQYGGSDYESLKLQRNPNVTVRSRGVMEKCTYCVQRINAARIDAKKNGERVADGKITTACQQVCPAGSITFGDTNDASSRVTEAKKSPRNYALLADLNTRPRTTYLAKVTNPNPRLAEG